MIQGQWQETLLSPGNTDQVWELFHENSKNSRYALGLSDQEVLERVRRLHESLPYEGYPIVKLPRPVSALRCSLGKAISTRVSVRDFVPFPLSLKNLATLLHYAYGMTRANKDTEFPRSFRVVPSAGALYPLDLFFHGAKIKGLKPGLYHYNPIKNHLRLLREGNETQRISHAMVQPDIALGASLMIFITAFFERTIFKYGDRGYRFILLEAGHVAQNINLVANALGLGCVNVGGFFDREIDDFLELDGVTHSTVYMIAVGEKKKQRALNAARRIADE